MLQIPPSISTPRLHLLRLTSTIPGHRHVQLFHANWSDPSITAWSLHGACTSLEDSRAWMITHMTEWDSYYYAVFVRGDGEGEEELVGSVSLRRQLGGPVLPPPGQEGKEVDLRVLAYGFFEKAWGNGYATEAASALIEAYRECVMDEKARGEKRFYVEAGVDTANPASRAVLRKVGFEEVGWKVEKEGVFLGGVWRENGGYWVWGMDV